MAITIPRNDSAEAMTGALSEVRARPGLLKEVYLTGIGKFLPNRPVGNDALDHYLGTLNSHDSRTRNIILKRNGIKTRYYAIDPETSVPTHTNVQLAAAAALQAMDRAEINKDDLDLLCAATSCPDQLMPNQAVMLQAEMGLRTLETAATSGVCCAGVTALKYAWMGIRSGCHRSALVTASENSSSILHSYNFQARVDNDEARAVETNPMFNFESIFLRWMLSDGAGAFVLRDRPGAGGLSFKVESVDLWSYAHLYEPCMYSGADKLDGVFTGFKGHRRPFEAAEFCEKFILRQDARLLDKHIIPVFGEALREFVRKHELSADAIDWFCPHISSYYFWDKVLDETERSHFPMRRKAFTNLESTGNTGSAAIFIMLEELANSGKIKSGQKVLCFVPESSRFSIGFFLLTAVGA